MFDFFFYERAKEKKLFREKEEGSSNWLCPLFLYVEHNLRVLTKFMMCIWSVSVSVNCDL